MLLGLSQDRTYWKKYFLIDLDGPSESSNVLSSRSDSSEKKKALRRHENSLAVVPGTAKPKNERTEYWASY